MWSTYFRKVTVKFSSEEFNRLKQYCETRPFRSQQSLSRVIRISVKKMLDEIAPETQARLEKSDKPSAKRRTTCRSGVEMSATRRRKSGSR